MPLLAGVRLARSRVLKQAYLLAFSVVPMTVSFLLLPARYLYRNITNGRRLLSYATDTFLTAAAPAGWLFLVHMCRLMPSSLRQPHIFHNLTRHLDDYMFDWHCSKTGSILTVVCLLLGAWSLHLAHYRPPEAAFCRDFESLYPLEPVGTPTSSVALLADYSWFADESEKADTDATSVYSSPRKSAAAYAAPVAYHPSATTNGIQEVTGRLRRNGSGGWPAAAPASVAVLWLVLNVVHALRYTESVSRPLFMGAWTIYVVVYVVLPPLTAAYLYLFQAPGTLKTFMLALTVQNLAILALGFVVPTAPPIYFKIFGPNQSPTYDMIYTDGMTTQDLNFNAFVHSSLYAVNPLRFALMPLLHSAVPSLCFFFVSANCRSNAANCVFAAVVVLQWWAAMFLNHNWRVDLLGGLLCAVLTFTLARTAAYGLHGNRESFLRARMSFDWHRGSTMGMRLFRSTPLQEFFDPL